MHVNLLGAGSNQVNNYRNGVRGVMAFSEEVQMLNLHLFFVRKLCLKNSTLKINNLERQKALKGSKKSFCNFFKRAFLFPN